MQGEYDIMLGNESIGKLSVRPDRGYTLFSARCKMINGLLRLSVYGEGREGYLGIAVPKDGELCLEKRLSPAAMRGFPDVIETAGQAGQNISSEKQEAATDTEKQSLTEENEPESSAADPQQTEENEKNEGTFWYASADGSLVSSGKGHEMIALPSGDGRIPKNTPGEKRIIEGREYFVFHPGYTETL